MNEEIPNPGNWQDMPKPRALEMISWEDVYKIAKDYSNEKYNRDPTREEIIEIFDAIKFDDPDAFWDTIRFYVDLEFDNSARETKGEAQ